MRFRLLPPKNKDTKLRATNHAKKRKEEKKRPRAKTSQSNQKHRPVFTPSDAVEVKCGPRDTNPGPKGDAANELPLRHQGE